MLLGPSGTGKSVLLKSMIGLLKPETGSITIHGTDLVTYTAAELYDSPLRVCSRSGNAMSQRIDSISAAEHLDCSSYDPIVIGALGFDKTIEDDAATFDTSILHYYWAPWSAHWPSPSTSNSTTSACFATCPPSTKTSPPSPASKSQPGPSARSTTGSRVSSTAPSESSPRTTRRFDRTSNPKARLPFELGEHMGAENPSQFG